MNFSSFCCFQDSDEDNVSTNALNLTVLRNLSSAESLYRGSVEIAARDYTELELQRARRAIRDAKYGNQTHLLVDKDYVPSGPMYWHAKALHR